MSYPPGPPDPNRPQDTPRGFPTYGRPAEPVNPPQQPQGWQPPGQPLAPYSQQYPPPAPYAQQQYPPPYGYGYGYGYPGTAMVKTNGLATAALVCGLGGLVIGLSAPVGVGLGIAALVQIKRRGESGKGQAIAGIVIGGLITAFGAGLLAIAILVGFSEGMAEGDSVPVDSLAVGECFDDGWGSDEAYRVSCSDAHDGEIVSNVTLPTGPYPGDNEVDDLSRARCDAEFAKYVGNTVDKSELESDYWYPDESNWDSGDRLIVCAAYGPDFEALTGTVKDSKR